MLQLKDTEKVTLTVSGVDAKGNQAPLPNAPVWAGTGTATITPSADGLSCEVVPGSLESFQVNVSDVLADGTTATGSLDITVVPGDAASIVIAAGTPTPQ